MKSYVVHEQGRFRLCRCERTPRGPRRRNLVTLGRSEKCRTVKDALAHWQKFLAAALTECKAEVEEHPDTYKSRRTWQRAAARCASARRRLKAIMRFA
jgi:hypothetical protein